MFFSFGFGLSALWTLTSARCFGAGPDQILFEKPDWIRNLKYHSPLIPAVKNKDTIEELRNLRTGFVFLD